RQAPAARAERAANREFFSANEHPGELKIRDVRARDQQHANDRTEEHVKTLPVLADGRVQQTLEREASTGVRVRIFLLERGSDRVHVGVRLLEGRPGFQSTNRAETRMIIAQE